MRVCPKCGFVDPPEWKHSKYSYWIDNITYDDFKKLADPNLADQIALTGLGKDEHYVYRVTKNKHRVERKAIADYGNQWTIPMERATQQRNVRDYRKVWSKLNPKQKKLVVARK